MEKWLVLVLAACGAGSDGGGGGGGGGGPDAAKPTRSGYVFLQSYDAMNVPGTPTRGGSASAGFYMANGACAPAMTFGACQLFACSSTTMLAQVSAGTVTFTGAAQPLMLAPKADHTYTTFTTNTATLFAGGESITFAASGADVPAFSKALTMPSKTTITSPTKPAAGTFMMVSRASDLSVSWSGGGSGSLQVFLSDHTGAQLRCRFPAGDGSGKVPAAGLGALSAGNGSFAMASITDEELDAGDYAIDVSAYANSVWPDDAIVSGGATLQ